MVDNRLSGGVGKKIVDALKKQSEVEIHAVSENEEVLEQNLEGTEPLITEPVITETSQADDLLSGLESSDLDNLLGSSEQSTFQQSQTTSESSFSQTLNQGFGTMGAIGNVGSKPSNPHENLVNELDGFEVPSNIAVLKKLITQLPTGVTRQTGAQIIRQTMEALGISMKSVLQEAQQLQEGLNLSAQECQSTIQEYKKQIIALEKQAQNHQRQYAALNELISLFIQTK